MSIRQISVFLENKPGRLHALTSLLAEKNVNILALSLAETADFGIARLIVENVDRTVQELRDGDFAARVSEVLAFAVPDAPGGLNRLLSEFQSAGINIEYMYSFMGRVQKGFAYMILCVPDAPAADAVLKARGLKGLTQDELQAT